MSLNKVIKKKLKETKVQKETLLIEEKIVRSRLMMIFENENFLERFNSLSEAEQGKLSILILMEISSLNEEGLISENFVDTISGLFGKAFWGGSETFIEKALNSFLSGIGIPDNSIRKFLVSFFSTNPAELLRAFRDCKVLSKHVARAIGETMIMNLQQTKGVGGFGWDMIRNVVQNKLQDLDFVKDVEDTISEKICELFGKFSGNAKEVMDKIKPALATATK